MTANTKMMTVKEQNKALSQTSVTGSADFNTLSFFDGMSNGQIALEKNGIISTNYFACEIDESAIKVTQKNYPKTKQLGDVSKVYAKDLPRIDLFIGGSPCQSFSSFGNGSGFDGKSGLFYEYVRMLNEMKQKNPDVLFMLENVNMKKEWRDIISKELGVEPIAFNSNLVSAQNRDRLYWTNIDFIVPRDRNILFKDVLENLPFREIPKGFFKNWGNKIEDTKIKCAETLKDADDLIDLTAYKIKNFELNLQFGGNLLYHEGIILSHSINSENHNEHYLYKWCDIDEKCNRWLIFKVTAENLISFFEENLTLLHLIQKNQFVYFVDFDTNIKEVNAFICPIQKIPDDYLPLERSFFKESQYEKYALILKDKLLNHN